MLQYQINSITKRLLFFIPLLVLANHYSFCQNQNGVSDFTLKVKDDFIRIYGMDPLLYNGILYKSFYPEKVKGDQYLASGSYVKGEVTIRGVKYKNLDLNFDIYKQELLLKYLNSNNAFNVIMVSKAWLEDFTIGSKRFEFYSTPETANRIYQVLGKNSIKLLYYWKKDLELDNTTYGNSNLCFTAKKQQNVLLSKSLKRFYNNRSFVHLFAKEKQTHIKKYLRQNKIKVNKEQDQAMEELINYCSKL